MSFASLFVAPTAYGDSARPESFAKFPANPVDPKRAIELASKHLDETHRLRRASGLGEDIPGRPENISVTLRGKYYLIVKENYPAINQSFYERFAVKVHKDTGEVIPPSGTGKTA